MNSLLVAALFVGASAILFPPKKVVIINGGNGTGKPYASFGLGPFSWEMGFRPWPWMQQPQPGPSNGQAMPDTNVTIPTITVPVTVIQPSSSAPNATIVPMMPMPQMPIMTVYYPPTTMIVPAGQEGQVLVPVPGQQGQFVDQTGGQTIFVPAGQMVVQQEVDTSGQAARGTPGLLTTKLR